MLATQFNDKVKTKVVVTIPLTITAFTSGDCQLAALQYILRKLESSLNVNELTDIKEWYQWADVWVVDLAVGKVDCSPAQRVQKLDVPAEEATEEA
jgi:hypothetical protein